MSVALLIPENWDVRLLVRWAVHFARAERSDLIVLFTRRRPEKTQSELNRKSLIEELSPDFDPQKAPELADLRSTLPLDFVWQSAAGSQDSSHHPDDLTPPEADQNTGLSSSSSDPDVKHQTRAVRIVDSDPTPAVLDQLNNVDLLIIPRHASVRIGADDFQMERLLFRDAPCRAMQLRPGSDTGETVQRILVPSGNAEHTNLALELASAIAKINDGQVIALFVEQEVDEVAELVGHRRLDRIVTQSLGRNPERLRKKVVLCNNVIDGIRSEVSEGYDLVLSSANYHGRVHRLLFHGISEQLLTTIETSPVAVLRGAMPLSSRIGRWIQKSAAALVPQLDREHRIALVDRIQSNSRWDFDFIALTCLSTLIAAMGLLQDSAAVVIGAMLVAPLMTPLLGAGLSLVQGNRILLKSALSSVLRGFLLAFAIGWLLGIGMRTFSPLTEPSPEMLARGSPGLLDLFVALISGIAAAYAIGRPNLLSALPGVAIAAALVPPIATSGLAAAFLDSRLAFGAALLFLTNIVAIILGTALSLWLVGIRTTHEHGSFHKWTTWIASLLILLAMGLAFFESTSRIQTDLVRALRKHLQQNTEYRLVEAYMNRQSDPPSFHVKVAGAVPASGILAEEVLEIAKQNGLNEVRLELETQIQTVVSESSD